MTEDRFGQFPLKNVPGDKNFSGDKNIPPDDYILEFIKKYLKDGLFGETIESTKKTTRYRVRRGKMRATNQQVSQFVGLLKDKINQARNETIGEGLLDLISSDSLGLNSDVIPQTRIFPVIVYLGGGENSKNVISAVNDFIMSLGFEIFDFEDPVISSFWQKFWAKTTSKATKKELKEAFEKGKEAIEAQQIDKPKSEIDLNRATAAASLMTALNNDSKSTTLLIGGILYVSIKDDNGEIHNRIIALTKEQNEYLQTNLGLMQNPIQLLAEIDQKLLTT